MGNKIVVSINCITYNQEKYIAETIESLLSQKTDFGYEILIQDDASTDGTPEIIKSYSAKYPQLIRPIIHSRNQFSQGVKVGIMNSKRAKGRYIAYCEGDDFWTDPYKLQKQVEFFNSYPDCLYCCHATRVINEDGSPTEQIIRPQIVKSFYSADEIIFEQYGPICQTSSVMHRRGFEERLPQYVLEAPQEDYALRVFFSTLHPVGYIDATMSAYRQLAKGSWNESIMNSMEKRICLLYATIETLKKIDIETGFLYSSAVKLQTVKLGNALVALASNKDFLKEENNRELFRMQTAKNRCKHWVRWCTPRLYKFLLMIKLKFIKKDKLIVRET